jgi:hypothetical protein
MPARAANRSGRTKSSARSKDEPSRDALQGLFGGGGSGGGGGDRADRQAARQERRAERQAQRSLHQDPALRQQAQDFAQRSTTGDNTQGYDAREAYQMYQQVGQDATPQQMQSALHQTVQNMTPNQRAEFGQMLQQRQHGQGTVRIPGGQAGGDPGTGGLLGMIGNLFSGGQGQAAPPTDHEGFLTHLFGGGQAPAPAPQSSAQGDVFPGFLDNPLAKVLMGGVAAYGAKQIADQYSRR